MDSATLTYLRDYLPDPFATLLHDNVFRDGAPLQFWSRVLASQAARAADAVRPYTALLTAQAAQSSTRMAGVVTPLLDRVARAAYNAPDVVVLLFVVVLVVLLLQLLSLLRRLLAWSTRLLFRLLFWSGVVLVLAAAWQRGLEQTAQDAAALVGRLCGYAAFVGDIWRAEYNKYQQQQAQAQALNSAAGGAASYQQRRGGGGGWSRR